MRWYLSGVFQDFECGSMRLECVILPICLKFAVHHLNLWYAHIYRNVIYAFLKNLSFCKIM